MKTAFRTCNVCEAMCGLRFTVDGDDITSVDGDPDDVFSHGHICPKGPAMREVWADPDRLRTPVRRVGDRFEPIGWQEALDETANRLRAIQADHGNDAVGLYAGNPTVHNHGASIFIQAFTKALRTKNRFDANSQDANPRLLTSMVLYGDQLSIPIPDVDRTDFLLMLGANPAASNGSIMTLGDVRKRMRDVTERGGRFVLIDPRRTETAKWASEHHFIRPGGDAPLLLAILHVLFAEDLVSRTEARALCRGLDDLEQLVKAFPPERVADAIGWTPDGIRQLARDFAAAPKAVAYGRVGTCLNPFGTVATWLIDALNIVTGNFDRPGGAMFTQPAVDVALLGRKLIGNRYNRWRSRVRGLPELGGQLPGAVMAEEMETPGAGQIRAFVTLAGNPVLSVPNGERIGRALSKLDFMVSIDIYINETTRHADIILPPLHALEQPHYDLVFSSFAVRNIARFSEPVVAPSKDGKCEWEIMLELCTRLGGPDFGFGKPVATLMRGLHKAGLTLTPEHVLDVLLRIGSYGDKFIPGGNGLSLKTLKENPHGIDLGPLRPCRETKILHDGQRVEICPEPFAKDVSRVSEWLDAKQTNNSSLVLIGRRHVRTNNSWMHNVASLVKGPSRCQLLMHPDDAARLGIKTGDIVAVTSRVGVQEAPCEVTDAVMRGVVSMPHGFGHQDAKATLRQAGAVDGANINALTDDLLVEPLSGTAILNGVDVEVSRVQPTASDDVNEAAAGAAE